MRVIVTTVLLLVASNVFMTFAWYAHLRNLNQRPWIVAAVQVPANRLGHTQLTLGQLKVLQEVITLTVFVPFAWLYMREPLRWNYLWAGLCLCGAVFFMFRR